jgi:hypothetical protein
VLDGTNAYITGFVAAPAGGGGGGKPQAVDFGSFSVNPIGRSDIFVAAINAKGSFQWANVFGSTRTDAATDIALNASGDVVFCGNFPTPLPLAQPVCMPMDSKVIFLSGCLMHQKEAGKMPTALVAQVLKLPIAFFAMLPVTPFLAIYFSGNFTFGSSSLNPIGGIDGALVAFDSNLQPNWAQSWGGTGNDFGNGVGLDPYGSIVVCGTFNGTITQNGQSITSNGGDDAIILAFDNSGNQTWIYTGGTSGNDNVREILLPIQH